MKYILVNTLVFILVACSPSEAAIQTALAQTQTDRTETPKATYAILPTIAYPTFTPWPKEAYILETGYCALFVTVEYLDGKDPKTDLCYPTEQTQQQLTENEYLTITDYTYISDPVNLNLYCALFKPDGTFIMSDHDISANGKVICSPSGRTPSNDILPTQTPAVTSSCDSASPQQKMNIIDGIDDVSPGNSIGNAWKVKSGDYENVWFVAAQITGPGIGVGDAIGLWAISGDPASPGLTYSVNSMANQFSSWGDGTKTTAQLSQFDDGAQEAILCAKTYP